MQEITEKEIELFLEMHKDTIFNVRSGYFCPVAQLGKEKFNDTFAMLGFDSANYKANGSSWRVHIPVRWAKFTEYISSIDRHISAGWHLLENFRNFEL